MCTCMPPATPAYSPQLPQPFLVYQASPAPPQGSCWVSVPAPHLDAPGLSSAATFRGAFSTKQPGDFPVGLTTAATPGDHTCSACMAIV